MVAQVGGRRFFNLIAQAGEWLSLGYEENLEGSPFAELVTKQGASPTPL